MTPTSFLRFISMPRDHEGPKKILQQWYGDTPLCHCDGVPIWEGVKGEWMPIPMVLPEDA